MSSPSSPSDKGSWLGSDCSSTRIADDAGSTLTRFDLLGATDFLVEEEESEVGNGDIDRSVSICSMFLAGVEDDEGSAVVGPVTTTSGGTEPTLGDPSIEKASSLPSSRSSRLRF